MKIAVARCTRGNIDEIYQFLRLLQREENYRVSLLIICGDMLTIRNPVEIKSMTLPFGNTTVVSKFYKYYSGERVAPVLTIFVGGMYEVLTYTSELPYGGWVCPNIYYMGHANVLNIGGLRIAGLSGIFNNGDYPKGHYEFPPYNDSFKSSMLNVRNLEVFRLKHVERPIDIFVSHDWLAGVYKNTVLNYLPYLKKYMLSYIEESTLGSPAFAELLRLLKPSYWFAAGQHETLAVNIPHNDKKRPKTEFTAFDNWEPGHQFLHIFDINSTFKNATNEDGNIKIEYDPEWLCILRNTNHLLNVSNKDTVLPEMGVVDEWDFHPTRVQMDIVHDLFQNDFKVPENFCITSPTYSSFESFPFGRIMSRYLNPQTQKFCQIMRITDPLDAAIIEAFQGDNSETSDFTDDLFEKDISVPEKNTIVLGSDEPICSNEGYLVNIENSHMSSIVSNEICIDTTYQASQLSFLDAGKSGATSNSSSSDPKPGCENFTPQPSCSSSNPKPGWEIFTPQPSCSSSNPKPGCENFTPQPSCSSSNPKPGCENFTPQPSCSSSNPKPGCEIFTPQPSCSSSNPKPGCENFTPQPSCSSSNPKPGWEIFTPQPSCSSSNPKPGCENFTPQPSCSSSDPGTSSTACHGSKKRKIRKPIKISLKLKSQGK